MRLLNTTSGRFVHVQDPRTVHYAVLSHVWSKEGDTGYVPEATFRCLRRIQEEHPGSSEARTLPLQPPDTVWSRAQSNDGEDAVHPQPPQKSIIRSLFQKLRKILRRRHQPPSVLEAATENGLAEKTAALPPDGNDVVRDSSSEDSSVVLLLPEKLRKFLQIAREGGFDLAWADMCCIDHDNPSEVAEAIDSMYDWYSYAKACYVFLADVSDRYTGSDTAGEREWGIEFRRSKWFTRVWTLQELLAPNNVIFLSKTWKVVGSKHSLARLIEDETAIERDVLTLHKPLDAVSVACRMSWAASRVATREEDRAYSLMGIFGVKIPAAYGEGGYAFYRLQEAIIQQIPDQTIFAWGSSMGVRNTEDLSDWRFSRPSEDALFPSHYPRQYLLASSPDDFKSCSKLVPLSEEEFAGILGIDPPVSLQTFILTAYGIRGSFPLATVPSSNPQQLALLACKDTTAGSASMHLLVALFLRPCRGAKTPASSGKTCYAVGTNVADRSHSHETPPSYMRAVTLKVSEQQQSELIAASRRVKLFISHRPTLEIYNHARDVALNSALLVDLTGQERVSIDDWSVALLNLEGYTVPDAVESESRLPGLDVKAYLKLSRSLRDDQQEVEVKIHVGYGTEHGAGSMANPLMVVVSCDAERMGLKDRADSGSGDAGPRPVQHQIRSQVSRWAVHRLTARKEIDLVFPSGNECFGTLRLVLTPELPPAADGHTGAAVIYRLGVEVIGPGNLQESIQHVDITPSLTINQDAGGSGPYHRAFPYIQHGRPSGGARR